MLHCRQTRSLFLHLHRCTVMIRSILVSAVALCTPLFLIAEPGGQAGRTSKLTAGCGDCHGGSPKTATTVTFDGPRSVAPNSTTTFTVVVAHPSFPSAGVGIAVRTTETGSTNVGTLTVVAGSGMRARNGEITQTSARPMSGGQIRFTFTWKAPAAPGTVYVQAIGNAVNGNGNDDANDSWNWLDPVAITVEEATSVAEIAEPRIGTWPNPFRSGVLTLGFEAVGTYDVVIMDLAGRDVVRTTANGTGAGLPIDVPTLPRGTYAVIARQASITKRTMVVVE